MPQTPGIQVNRTHELLALAEFAVFWRKTACNISLVPGLGLRTCRILSSAPVGRLCPLCPTLAGLVCPVCPPGIQQAPLAQNSFYPCYGFKLDSIRLFCKSRNLLEPQFPCITHTPHPRDVYKAPGHRAWQAEGSFLHAGCLGSRRMGS